MFPDTNLGIYTAMSGDDEDFFYRYSLHQYLADMYLGETPWLNATTICSFPSPWFPPKRNRTKPNISRNLQPQRTLDEYLGVYENPAYGKIEMFILDEPDANNKLIAEFGYVDLILYPKKTKDEFFFETDGIAAKLINFGTVQFKEEKGIITKMRIPTFEPKDPPIFKRIHTPQPIPTEPANQAGTVPPQPSPPEITTTPFEPLKPVKPETVIKSSPKSNPKVINQTPPDRQERQKVNDRKQPETVTKPKLPANQPVATTEDLTKSSKQEAANSNVNAPGIEEATVAKTEERIVESSAPLSKRQIENIPKNAAQENPRKSVNTESIIDRNPETPSEPETQLQKASVVQQPENVNPAPVTEQELAQPTEQPTQKRTKTRTSRRRTKTAVPMTEPAAENVNVNTKKEPTEKKSDTTFVKSKKRTRTRTTRKRKLPKTEGNPAV